MTEILADVVALGEYADPGLIFTLIDARDAAPADDRELWDDAIEGFMERIEEGDFA